MKQLSRTCYVSDDNHVGCALTTDGRYAYIENDTTSLQMVLNSRRLLLFYLISKEIAYRNGVKKSGKKKQTKSRHEQAAEVQNSILLWNLISIMRKASSQKKM